MSVFVGGGVEMMGSCGPPALALPQQPLGGHALPQQNHLLYRSFQPQQQSVQVHGSHYPEAHHLGAVQTPTVAAMPTLVPQQTGSMPPASMTLVQQPTVSYALVQQPALQVVQPTQAVVQGQPAVGQGLSTIFFAGASPVVAPESLLSLFAQFGRVMDLNLFRPYKGCRTSKGCGLVVFSNHSEAAAALETLHGRFVWPGARTPMVIEWCDPSKQHKRKRAQPLAPAVLQHLPFQQQAMPCMQTLMPVLAAPPGLGQPMPAACSGQLVMSGY